MLEMVEIVGKYQHVVTINPQEFINLVGFDVNELRLMEIEAPDSTLTIKYSKDVYSFSITLGPYWERIIRFVPGEPFLEGDDGEVLTVVTTEGNRFIFDSRTDKNGTWKRIYEFSEDGVEIILDRGSGTVGRRSYKKIR